MANRVYNFYPGPAALPLEVLEKAQSELLDYRETGMSVMEISHRSSEFEEVVISAEALLLELYGLSDDYQVLFLQGGASMQFAMIPLNFLPAGTVANYTVTGSFAEKAYQEASRIGETYLAASTKENGHRYIPRPGEIKISENAAYLHMTTNNTIYGTQWKYVPDCGDVPIVADMSSDILSRELDISSFDLAYAGAQKNLGPAGVTAVIIRKSLLQTAADNVPAILSYREHAAARSLYNTPPCFAIYILKLVLEWVKEKGGIQSVGKYNSKKASLVYRAIDESEGFYRGHAAVEDRSAMNVTFRLPGEELEKEFLAEAANEGLVGLKGHRSVGGIRASMYNAMPMEGCRLLSRLMKDFCSRKG